MSIGIKCAPGVVGPAEADIDFDIIRNDNDTFTVKYTPRGAGSYTIMVLFADQVRAPLTAEGWGWGGGQKSVGSNVFTCFVFICRPPPPAPSESRWILHMMPAKSRPRDLDSTGVVSWGTLCKWG